MRTSSTRSADGPGDLCRRQMRRADKLGTLVVAQPSLRADFSDIMTTPLNEAPEVSGGPFVFQSSRADENVILTRNERYWEGAPYVDGMI